MSALEGWMDTINTWREDVRKEGLEGGPPPEPPARTWDVPVMTLTGPGMEVKNLCQMKRQDEPDNESSACKVAMRTLNPESRFRKDLKRRRRGVDGSALDIKGTMAGCPLSNNAGQAAVVTAPTAAFTFPLQFHSEVGINANWTRHVVDATSSRPRMSDTYLHQLAARTLNITLDGGGQSQLIRRDDHVQDQLELDQFG
ncbi:hypothetical protein DFH09DRAFT_1453842 [Mycena vulgaris]|nr:hypothetical protein DFH09DRAFT_1453842 [Mycena vulgaris]